MIFQRKAHKILAILIALMLLFIWSNSLAGSKQSNVTEYAILGMLLAWLSIPIKKQDVWLLLFVVLTTAVIDETIQIFTGRTSQVQDIWIDFFGAGAGMLVVYLVMKLAQTRKRSV